MLNWPFPIGQHPSNIAFGSGPGDIKPTSGPASTASASRPTAAATAAAEAVKLPATIEEWQQQHEQDDLDALESRACPDYSIAYKQTVSTEDVFLQMGNKTAATASCDEMVISIDMPDETVGIERMDLAVHRLGIDLQSPVYRLKMPLPHPINPDAGSAKYDAAVKRLTLRLKMVREFDYVNF